LFVRGGRKDEGELEKKERETTKERHMRRSDETVRRKCVDDLRPDYLARSGDSQRRDLKCSLV